MDRPAGASRSRGYSWLGWVFSLGWVFWLGWAFRLDRPGWNPRRGLRRTAYPLAAALAVLVAAAPPAAASASVDGPTINFTATGTVPVVCGTRPSVSGLSVRVGTEIVIANVTTVAGSVEVGEGKLVNLGPGAAAVVVLGPGQHAVALVPDCAVVGDLVAAEVTVLAAPPDGAAAAPASGTREPEQSAGPEATPSRNSAAAALSAGTPSSQPEAPALRDGAPAAIAVTAPSAAAARREARVIAVQPVTGAGPRDPKGGRLLAVVAAICLIGVTAGIIRAIVSQGTSGVVSV